MWELVKSGGLLMLPILIASVLAMAICFERAWALRASRVAPPNLLAEVWGWIKNKQLDAEKLRQLKAKRYLSVLGTLAMISPLLGLLGTVVGIIEAFMAINTGSGMGDPSLLASGISKALMTTAGGLFVAIPAMIMHRYFVRHISTMAVEMEQQAIKMVDIVHGDREVDFQEQAV